VARESGIDLSDVTVHRSSAEPGRVGAHAHAAGSHIHLAPGADRHLAHEAWHLVQQRQGRVPVTGHAGRRALNTDPALEGEAEAMGARLAAAPATGPVAARVAQPPRDAPLQQKSAFAYGSPKPKEPGAKTPLDTLHTAFEPFFSSAGVTEYYIFGPSPLNQVLPDAYPDKYDRAGEVEAYIDGGFRGGNGNDRDGKIIAAYGHFGSMERAIFNRPNRGHTYDGGHLIEHTLMEGKDADVHGNLAPQEGAYFNQALMRGWEKVPERLQHKLHRSFTYRVKVTYSDDEYTRTGQNLLDAKVLPGSLESALPPLDQNALKAVVAKFRRWVPHTWEAEVIDLSGTGFPSLSLTMGTKYYQNLVPSLLDVANKVFDTTATTHTHAFTNPRPRSYSGTLAGFIQGAKTMSVGALLSLPSQSAHKATMMQPEPQDFQDQPHAVTNPGSTAAAVLPDAPPVKNLKEEFSLTKLRNSIGAIQFFKLDRKKSSAVKVFKNELLNPLMVEGKAKKAIPAYEFLRTHGYIDNAKDGALILRILSRVSDAPVYSTKEFTADMKKEKVSVECRNRLFELMNDAKFVV
jgi:hypothetical protein